MNDDELRVFNRKLKKATDIMLTMTLEQRQHATAVFLGAWGLPHAERIIREYERSRKSSGKSSGTISGKNSGNDPLLQQVVTTPELQEPQSKETTLLKDLISYYQELFTKQFGEKPNLAEKKEIPLLNRIYKKYGYEKTRDLLGRFFASDDPFIQQSGYTLGVFSSCLNKLISGPISSQNATLSTPKTRGNLAAMQAFVDAGKKPCAG